MPKDSGVAVVGAGLVGSLLSVFLARRGVAVDVYERRPDMRRQNVDRGRSINLAVSTRGLHALRQVGFEEEILRQAVPMRGRMIHASAGEVSLQRYGRDDSECIHSISRADLNKTLMTRAEGTGRVRLHFERKCDSLDDSHIQGRVVIGTDGSASAIRHDLMRARGFECAETALDYGYKELVIPPGPGGAFRLEKNALHIWPRGTYMLIALPNFDGSFTCTLFLPFEGPASFARLKTPAEVAAFFETQFADALPLIPDLTEAFFANPTGHMVTVKCQPWNAGGRALLVGDAAHAIVPFFGQGMNCGFEDCVVLDECLGRLGLDWPRVFDEFFRLRKTHTDAIADMAVENFVEMRDKVADHRFLLEKAVEKVLQERFPSEYISRYQLVTFSRVPYRVALEAGLIESAILAELCGGMTRPEQAREVDVGKAEALIRSRLTPYLAPYLKGHVDGSRNQG